MRQRVDGAVGAIRRANRAVHHVAGAALIAMLALTLFDILGRWLFNSPVAGTVETIPLLLVIVVYLGFAHAQHLGDHIAVDLVFSRLGARSQHVLSVFSHIFSLAVLALVTWQLWKFAGVQERGGYATAVIEWPIHWFVRIAALGSALLWLATLAETVAELFGSGAQDVEREAGPVTGAGREPESGGDR